MLQITLFKYDIDRVIINDLLEMPLIDFVSGEYLWKLIIKRCVTQIKICNTDSRVVAIITMKQKI